MSQQEAAPEGPHSAVALDTDTLLFELEEDRPIEDDQLCERHLPLDLLALLTPGSTLEAKLLRDVRTYKACAHSPEEHLVAGLADWLAGRGYLLRVRRALGGSLDSLRHHFLVVQGSSCEDLIVEPAFQAHFQIGGVATPRFQRLLSLLPDEVVATRATLALLVELLCGEMELAFAEHGMTLPPWRRSKAMLSKWLPSRSRDCSPAGSPRGHFDTAASVFAAGPGSPVTPQACHAGAGAACPVLAGGFGEQLQQLAAGRQAGSNAAPQVLCLRKARSLLSPMLSRPVRAASAPDGLSCHGLAAAAGWASGQQGQQCMGASWAQPPTRTVKMRGPQCGRAGQASAVQWA